MDDQEIYVEVIDSSCVREGKSNIPGVATNGSEWNKYHFFPNNGVVGQVMGEAISAEGKLLLVQCLTNVAFLILPKGVRIISKDEAQRKYSQNKTIGYESEPSSRLNENSINSLLDKFF